MWFWKFTWPAKIFTSPANICTSPVKFIYTAGKISTFPDWKITCPVGHVTTKNFMCPETRSTCPGHALMSSPGIDEGIWGNFKSLYILGQCSCQHSWKMCLNAQLNSVPVLKYWFIHDGFNTLRRWQNGYDFAYLVHLFCRANALANMQSGQGPSVNLKSDDIAAIKAGGRSVEELTGESQVSKHAC